MIKILTLSSQDFVLSSEDFGTSSEAAMWFSVCVGKPWVTLNISGRLRLTFDIAIREVISYHFTVCNVEDQNKEIRI